MPKLSITVVKRLISEAASEDRVKTASCSAQPGLYVRVTPGGSATYYYRYRDSSGKQVRIPLGRHGNEVKSPDMARDVAGDYARMARKGDDPRTLRQVKKESPTLADLWLVYLEQHAKPRKKSWQKDEQVWRVHIEEALGRSRVKDVSRENVTSLVREVGVDKGLPGAANKVLALLSKMLTQAVELGYRADNPCRGLTRSPKLGGAKFTSRSQHRYLTTEEIKRVLDALGTLEDRVAAAALRWILLTGQRHSEALDLKWSDVDAQRCRVRLADTKTGPQYRSVSEAAIQVLAQLSKPDLGDCFVFHSPRHQGARRANLYHWWYTALKAAKVSRCRIHDLRHTAASLAAANGASLMQIGAMLGHSSPQATYIYAHLVDADTRAVADGVASLVESAESSKTSS